MSVVKRLKDATGQVGIVGVVKQAGLSLVLDGNWLETTLQLSGGAGARLVGEDPLGNKYYEDNSRPYGRHRWVQYKNVHNYNASSVHPTWHAWLHCVSDDTPVDHPPKQHKFDVTYAPNASDTPGKYLPKGSWANPQQRNWLKVQFWTPPK